MYRGVVEDFAADVLPLQGFAPSCACVVAVICEIGQPGGWRTPTTALCARRAGASRLPSDGPRPLLPTSTLARGAREAKNRHPSATMEPRSPLLRRASRGGRSPTPSPRVDRRRARVPLVSACAIRMCRGGGFLPGCFLFSGRRACFVGSLRGKEGAGCRAPRISDRYRVLLWAWKAGDGWFVLVDASSELDSLASVLQVASLEFLINFQNAGRPGLASCPQLVLARRAQTIA